MNAQDVLNALSARRESDLGIDDVLRLASWPAFAELVPDLVEALDRQASTLRFGSQLAEVFGFAELTPDRLSLLRRIQGYWGGDFRLRIVHAPDRPFCVAHGIPALDKTISNLRSGFIFTTNKPKPTYRIHWRNRIDRTWQDFELIGDDKTLRGGTIEVHPLHLEPWRDAMINESDFRPARDLAPSVMDEVKFLENLVDPILWDVLGHESTQ